MYKLIIVDDEQVMLKSIARIMDWETLGFEICGTFANGAQAAEFIENNVVDVVLTDIKMPIMDGLSLCEFIYNKFPHIKTIIISGHQDFEFARQAIKYNVMHYLLKPTRYSEIVQTFESVRALLDQSKREQNQFLPLIARQFFFDIYTGAIQNTNKIENYFQKLMLDKAYIHHPCVVSMLTMQNYHTYMNTVWKHDLDGFTTAIWQIFHVREQGVCYYFFNKEEDKFWIIGIGETEQTDIYDKTKVFLESKIEQLQELLNASFTIEQISAYTSIVEFSKHCGPCEQDGGNVEEEYQRLLLYYINLGDVEAVANLLNKYYAGLNKDIAAAQSFNAKLMQRLQSNSNSVSWDTLELGGKELEQCGDFDLFKTKSRQMFTRIASYVHNHAETSEKLLINKAKEYIDANCCNDISLESLAHSIYVSPVYISRLFKEQTGQNFIDYLVELRMKKAMELLKDHRLKVYEVSEQVGYKSLKYFYKLFKRYTGITPTEFRNH